MGEIRRVGTLADVPPGSCRQVDVDGKAVALFNVDGKVYAVGGTCTHRGGPLGEGELNDKVVTCPWHGAQFDVTTGYAVGPPASQNVPTYNVVITEADVINVETA